jgi:hypothetical protein
MRAVIASAIPFVVASIFFQPPNAFLNITWDDLVLPPLPGKTGSPVALLFGQGAGIATDLYGPLGLALQEAAPFPLWFSSPQCPENIAAIPGGLQAGSITLSACNLRR